MAVEKIDAYRTTDGQIFVDRAEAETVQRGLSLHDKIKNILFDDIFYAVDDVDETINAVVNNIEEIVKAYNKTR